MHTVSIEPGWKQLTAQLQRTSVHPPVCRHVDHAVSAGKMASLGVKLALLGTSTPSTNLLRLVPDNMWHVLHDATVQDPGHKLA